jgi:thioredoxin 1
LTANKVILVDFYADWCGPCRRLKPIIHEIADEYAGRVVVASVNVDNLKDVAEKYGVYSIPDVRVFRAGKVSDSFIGVRSKKTYTEILDKVPAPATNG